MPSASSTSEPSKAAKVIKGSSDRLRAFEVAAYDLRETECDKNWQNVDKALQVLLKSSDMTLVMDHESVLINLHWIITRTTATSGPIWNSVGLLTKICVDVPRCRVFLRDQLGLTSSLTHLLASLPSSNSKAVKVLELLRYVVYGIAINRNEAYLEKLICQLLRCINSSKDVNLTAMSLSIMACLCHRNYIVGKLLLSKMTTEERKDLYSKTYEDARTTVFLDHLLTCLSRNHLLGTSKKYETGVERHLSNLSEAFCAAYPENDCLTLRLCIDFLGELQPQLQQSTTEAAHKEAVMHIIRQIFCIADFAEGSWEANSLLFTVARQLASIHGPSLALVDVTAKTLLLYLEVGNAASNHCSEAVLMLCDVLKASVVLKAKDSDETMMASLRLQIDSVLSTFNRILTSTATSSAEATTDDLLTSLQSILECSLQIAQIDDWTDLVIGHFAQPTSIVSRMRSLGNTSDCCTASILALIFQLADTLRKNNKKWERVFADDLETDETIVRSWVACFEARCHVDKFGHFFNIIQSHKATSDLFIKLLSPATPHHPENVHNMYKSTTEHHLTSASGFNLKKIDEALKSITEAIENNDVNESLAGIWELNEFKLMAHQHKLDAMRESLKAADDQIGHQKMLNIQLEHENKRLNAFTKQLLQKMDVTQKEILDVRQQSNALHNDASEYRTETLKDLKGKEEDIEVLEGNQAKLMAKVAKYKEQLEALQDTIKEHQTVQAQLQEKIKAEAKANSDMTSALAKKDEKLKKKEKLLMEESVNQDSMKKELEGLKKEISSLHTLNKRLDQALVKKDKQYTEVSEQLSTFKQVHAQIFSLSKTVSSTGDNE